MFSKIKENTPLFLELGNFKSFLTGELHIILRLKALETLVKNREFQRFNYDQISHN